METAEALRDQVLDLEQQVAERDERIRELEDQLRGERIKREKITGELTQALRRKK